MIMVFKPLHMEFNPSPSMLNTSDASAGVPTQLASQAQKEPQFDNVPIEQMRDNPLYDRLDDIDKVGLAQRRIVESADKVKSKTRVIRAFNDHAQKLRIPKQPNV